MLLRTRLEGLLRSWCRQTARFLAALLILVLAALQVATGAANVVLQWPLAAALVHTAGAAALVVALVALRTSAGLPFQRAGLSARCDLLPSS